MTQLIQKRSNLGHIPYLQDITLVTLVNLGMMALLILRACFHGPKATGFLGVHSEVSH